jgi:hypothetical protein
LNENYVTNYHDESVVFNDSTENNGATNDETVVLNANYLTGKIWVKCMSLSLFVIIETPDIQIQFYNTNSYKDNEIEILRFGNFKKF